MEEETVKEESREKESIYEIYKRQNPKLPKVKLNKISLIIMIGVGAIFIGLLLLRLINWMFPRVGTFIWLNVRNPIYDVLFGIFQGVPQLGSNIGIINMVVMVICFILEIIVKSTRKVKHEIRNRLYNILECVLIITVLIAFFPSMMDSAYANAEKINVLYGDQKLVVKEYSKDDLVRLTYFLEDKVVNLAEQVERVDGKVVFDDELVNIAVRELENSSNKYKFLKGKYPSKVGEFSNIMKATNYDEVLGYTNFVGVTINSLENDVAELNTIIHEMCHVKGTLRESETEYCSFLASVDSIDDRVAYSAYFSAYTRVVDVLEYIDSKEAIKATDKFYDLCLDKGYEEVCKFKTKQADYYFEGADELRGKGYQFSKYGDRKDDVLEFIDELKKYDLKLYIDEGSTEISIDDFKKLIENNSADSLYFSINVDEKEFAKISKILSKYDKYYIASYQIDYERDDEFDYDNEMSEEEYLNYYLAPFIKNDYFMDDDYMDEYDYGRATRHYLEYFDGEY